MVKNNNIDKLDHKKKKTWCAVKNPSVRSNQSWFYNIFLGNITNNKRDINKIKMNWLIELDDEEIKLLREKSCNIIEINIKIKTDVETQL